MDLWPFLLIALVLVVWYSLKIMYRVLDKLSGGNLKKWLGYKETHYEPFRGYAPTDEERYRMDVLSNQEEIIHNQELLLRNR